MGSIVADGCFLLLLPMLVAGDSSKRHWSTVFEVFDEGGFDPPPAVRRCYAFKGNAIGTEACVDLTRPFYPSFEYIRAMFVASLVIV